MKNKFLKGIAFFTVIALLIVLPLGIEKLILNGVFGYTFPNTNFSNEQWFAFWGSYLGSIITVIVLFVTIKYNKSETRKMLKDYELEMQYNRLLKNIEEIHNYINLCDSSGEPIEQTNIIYMLKILEKRYFELMNECEISNDYICEEYIVLVKQIFYEYLLEAKKVPKNFDDVQISDASEIYIEATKKIISIKHKYVQQEPLLYDKTVSEVERSKMKKKRALFDI